MLRVYGDVNSGNCYKIKLLMHQLELPYQWLPVDILAGQSRSAQFLAMNPKGQIPVLEIAPDTVLTESNAILHYLADGSHLLPQERLAHARVLEWMFFEQYNHEPSVASARYIIRYLGRPAEREQLLQKKIADGYQALQLMEQQLARTPYLIGDNYTIADIALYAYTHVAHEGGFDLSRFPGITGWLARVAAQPGYVGMV